MVTLEEGLSKLESVAQELNEATDGLNDVIERIERRLAGMAVGVSAWDGAVIEEVTHSVLTPDQDGVSEGYLLGYAKLGDDWRLCAKRVTCHEGFVDQDTSMPWGPEFEDQSDPVPLSQAPRVVRVEAAARLEPLIDRIRKKAERFVKDIKAAEELAVD